MVTEWYVNNEIKLKKFKALSYVFMLVSVIK